MLLQTAWRRKGTKMKCTLKAFAMEHSVFMADHCFGYGDSRQGKRKFRLVSKAELIATMASTGVMHFLMQTNR
jgi:hypothetical protein